MCRAADGGAGQDGNCLRIRAAWHVTSCHGNGDRLPQERCAQPDGWRLLLDMHAIEMALVLDGKGHGGMN